MNIRLAVGQVCGGQRCEAIATALFRAGRAEALEGDAALDGIDLTTGDGAQDAAVAIAGHAQVRRGQRVGMQLGILDEDLAGER